MAKARNAKCSCGSGKKYKLCHGLRTPAQRRRSNLSIGLVVLAVVAFAFVGVFTAVTSNGSGDNAGRVWSAEHGHWHDSAGGELGGAAPASTSSNGPGPGKVWSAEHNHWH